MNVFRLNLAKKNQILGNIFKDLLLPKCIVVETNASAGKEIIFPIIEAVPDGGFEVAEPESAMPEPIKTLVRSLEADQWTEDQKQVLPDGIRDNYMPYYAIELLPEKISIQNAFLSIVACMFFYYDGFSLNHEHFLGVGVKRKPFSEKWLTDLKYKPVSSGVYRSESSINTVIQYIVIDELPCTSWNAPFKVFASDQDERKSAENILKEQGVELRL
ncbi:MAG: hypothetical protein OMM_01986 [Candidatus Magnetoglobus multicellularis str. Araruama]|uniref:Uncharacterized protein n=1 Tax=Candidatus Magnetoglobus multicellularis str. Araruama TaxID=890399 RepID=A0A1V1PBC8_9BACT|nr:MAG: hypothetical protein OMM_01986 [Candidatus Magnetoglobus multicellularis str. Araruama]